MQVNTPDSRFTEKTAVFYMMIGGIIISFSGVFVKLAHIPPTVSAFYRVLIGGVVLALMVLINHEMLWHSVRYACMTGACGLFFAMDLYAWHRSILYIGPGLATVLANFQVFILTAVGVIFLGEKINLKMIISAPLGIIGLGLVVGIEWETLHLEYRIGVLWGFVAAGCYAAFTLMLRKLQRLEGSLSPKVNLMLISLTSSIILGINAWHSGESFQILDIQTLLSMLALGIMCQVVGWIVITRALRELRPSVAGLILLLQPTLAFVWDITFFQRVTTLLNLVGIVLTLGAIYLGSTLRQKPKV